MGKPEQARTHIMRSSLDISCSTMFIIVFRTCVIAVGKWPTAARKVAGTTDPGVEAMRDQNQKRSNLQVMADILRLGEAGKTEIMYNANMSYHQLQKYLGFMMEQGLLEKFAVPNPGVKYRPTAKGQDLLRRIDGVLEVLGFQD